MAMLNNQRVYLVLNPHKTNERHITLGTVNPSWIPIAGQNSHADDQAADSASESEDRGPGIQGQKLRAPWKKMAPPSDVSWLVYKPPWLVSIL